jgi:hypothetical protein
MSENQKRRRAGGADVDRPWTAEENEAVRALTPQDAAAKTGRTIRGVWARRQNLKVNPAVAGG